MSSPPTTLLLNDTWGPCPPGGFRYVDPEDGFLAHAWAYVDWVNVQMAHLQANQRSIPPNLGELMQTQLCQSLQPGWCKYDDPSRPRPSTVMGWNDVLAGVKTFSRWMAAGAKYVPQAEADRRASVCAKCYLNVNIEGCSGCQAAVQEVVRDKHSKFDNSLRACAVCKCFLKAKVHFPMDILDTEADKVQEMYPGFCWLNKASENYRG